MQLASLKLLCGSNNKNNTTNNNKENRKKKLSVARKAVLQKFHTATANVENLAIFKRSVVDQF